MIEKFDKLVEDRGYSWKLREIMPKVLCAGDDAGCLTEEGVKLLDPTGTLQAGIPVCPPEGDAGTGMIATNSVAKRTGNVSAGTSVFAMIVLEKELSKVYTEIDMVTTPSGSPVAMAHANNCTSDLNAWVNIFKEYSEAMGMKVDMNTLFGTLYNKALEGDADCGVCYHMDIIPVKILFRLMKADRYLFVHQTVNSILQTLCVHICMRHSVHSRSEWISL